MFRKKRHSFKFHVLLGHLAVILHYDGDDGHGKHAGANFPRGIKDGLHIPT